MILRGISLIFYGICIDNLIFVYYNNINVILYGGAKMKFSAEKKNSIIMYMLEKIEQKESDISKTVAEKCDISRNTVNEYLKELQEQDIICKVKRNQYVLNTETYKYHLRRSRGEIDSDTYAYDKFFEQHIKNCTEEARRIWQYSFSEMANNVMDHSNAENLYITVEKNFLSTSVSFVDDGIGIFEKIREHFSLADLDEARCELFKGKLTTDSANHSGEGIFFTSRMMDEFVILSSGKIFRTDKYEEDFNIDTDLPVSGTCVIMSLSNFTHRRIADIFNQYSSVDGGFTKTRIPMRNIFDNAPVSRSQAKRLYNRLDNFNEVIFDFEGMDWMGQAFAHQLFVVYQNAHPDTILEAVNMSENIEMMYKHVIQTK